MLHAKGPTPSFVISRARMSGRCGSFTTVGSFRGFTDSFRFEAGFFEIWQRVGADDTTEQNGLVPPLLVVT